MTAGLTGLSRTPSEPCGLSIGDVPGPVSSVTTLAQRLVAVGADLALVRAVGDAFGYATGALLSEMRRVGSVTTSQEQLDPFGRKLDKDGWPARWSDPAYLGDGADGA